METQSKYGKWILTEEQAQKIVAKDADAMAQFYNDNYKRIRSKAIHYIREHAPSHCIVQSYREPSRYSLDDMMQQAYVDLPYIDFRDVKSIGLSFYRIFHRVDVGGITSTTEPRTLGLCVLDAPCLVHSRSGDVQATSMTTVDRIASKKNALVPSAEDTYLLTLEDTTQQEYLSQHTIRDILFDILSFGYEYSVMMYEIFTNWTDYEISEFLGLSKWDTVEKIRERAGRTLAGQYHTVVDKLREIDSPYYDRFWSLLPKQEENKRSAMCSFGLRANSAVYS